jgi:hypothetical protein
MLLRQKIKFSGNFFAEIYFPLDLGFGPLGGENWPLIQKKG